MRTGLVLIIAALASGTALADAGLRVRRAGADAVVEVVGGANRTELGVGYFGIRVDQQGVILAIAAVARQVARQVPVVLIVVPCERAGDGGARARARA